MIFSAQQLFSDNQAITASAFSDNTLDLGLPGTPYGAQGNLNQDIGKGNPIPILIQITEGFNNLTSLTVRIMTGPNENYSSSVILSEQSIAVADAVAGKQLNVQVLPNGADQRYLFVQYAITGTAPTTGKITAGVSMGNQTNITGA